MYLQQKESRNMKLNCLELLVSTGILMMTRIMKAQLYRYLR